jgi:membrane protein DedA with SNARE-associated domain
VENEFANWISGENDLAIHLTILSMLFLGGIGFPIPEDIPLILAGVAAGKGLISPYAVWGTCYFGVILADQIVFWAGYFFGARILKAGTQSRFLPLVTEEKIEEVREGLRKRRLAFIFLGRHLFPVRSLTFLTAGALKIPYLEFLLSDAIAALVSVTLVKFNSRYH